MAITVRSLLAKVKPFRKDLEEDRALYAIQEAVRKICRQTMLAESMCYLRSVNADSTITIPKTLGEPLRVKLVRMYSNLGGPGSPNYAFKVMYEWNQVQIDDFEPFRDYPTSVTTGWAYRRYGVIELYPTPNAATCIFTADITGTQLNVTAVTSGTLKIGDMVYGTNSTVPNYISAMVTGTGLTGTYTLGAAEPVALTANPMTANNSLFEVSYSYIPTTEFDAIPLPDEAEDCIVAGALSTLLMLPGSGQNLNLAKDREKIHGQELGVLRSHAEFGESGRLRANGRVLATRSIRSNANRWY